VEGFRWALLGTPSTTGTLIGVSFGAVLVVFAGGVVYFRRMEKHFADLV